MFCYYFFAKTDKYLCFSATCNAVNKRSVAAEQGLRTGLGSEVYVSEQEQVKGIPMFGRYLLIEFSTRYAPANLMDKIRSVLPLTPIIAHIERYGWLDPDSAVVDEMKDMGCLIQVNGKAFGKGSGGERINRFLERGVVDIIASDSHGSLEDIRDMAASLAANPQIIRKMGSLAR